MTRPLLRQFIDLAPADFEAHPVWVACHSADYDEPWHDDTDEETYRPWTGALPVDAIDDIYVVAAKATLHDGTVVSAFLTPSVHADDPGAMQPHIFVDNTAFAFWGGSVGIARSDRAEVVRRLGKQPDEVFPIHIASSGRLALGSIACDVAGWMELKADPPIGTRSSGRVERGAQHWRRRDR